MTKELYDMRTRFISILSIVIVLFFVVAPFQNLTTSMLEGYSDNPALEKLMTKRFCRKVERMEFLHKQSMVREKLRPNDTHNWHNNCISTICKGI